MKTHYFRITNEFINPFSLRELSGINKIEVIIQNGTFKLCGMNFSGDKTLNGIFMFFPNRGLAYLKSDFENAIVEKTQERIKQIIEKQRQRQDKITEAKNFYKRLSLPFKFHVNIKEVLSGLSINSNGDGVKKNTVFHLIVDEPIKIGRLKRETGDFLCSTVKSKFGADWSGTKKDPLEIEKNIPPIITCQSCLKKLKSIQETLLKNP